MLVTFVISFVLIAIAAFLVKQASRAAPDSRRFLRNRFIWIWILSTGSMAGLILLKQPSGLSVMFAWLPAMIVGVLVEHLGSRRRRPD